MNVIPIRRGDVVVVTAAGDYGKPRPAVVVQTDAFPLTHASVIVCQMTSKLADLSFRVTIEPTPETGLQARSQVMVDKPITVRRDRVRQRIGRLGAVEVSHLNAVLAFVTGLSG